MRALVIDDSKSIRSILTKILVEIGFTVEEAGNIKSLLPTPCSISLPSVAVTDHDLHHPRSETVTSVNFVCDNMQFFVVMLQKEEKSD